MSGRFARIVRICVTPAHTPWEPMGEPTYYADDSRSEKRESNARPRRTKTFGHCVRTVISLDTSMQLQQVGIISFLSNGSIYARIHVAASCNRAYRASKRCTFYISTNAILCRVLSRRKLLPEAGFVNFYELVRTNGCDFSLSRIDVALI